MSSSEIDSVHIWYRCAECGTAPITGRCYRCQTCPAGPDNDLCEACYQRLLSGEISHPPADYRTVTEPAGTHEFAAEAGKPTVRFGTWLEVPAISAPAPTVPDRFVVRPEFQSTRQTAYGAHGFVVAAQNPGPAPLFMTALHVLDELIRVAGVDAGVANDAYTGRELPAVVTKVVLYDVFAPQWILAELGTAGPMLVLPDARVDEEEPYSERDVAAFEIGDLARLQPGRLADAPPVVGEPIWLTVPAEGAPTSRCCAAVVVESTDRTLIFRFTDALPALKYTSGAPLLNAAGEVVGINVGAGVLAEQSFGHGATVASLHRHLRSASRWGRPAR